MPKLINRNPKLSKLKKYAVSYYCGKIHYFGLHGTPEALTAYNRFCAELQANPSGTPPKTETHVTVRELTATFLDHAATNMDSVTYSFFRVVALDFLDAIYGDNFPADDFTPRCLKLVRDEMIKSRRYCRNILNRCVKSIITIFAWGVEHEMVQEKTWSALKTVKSLQEGHPGTFDHDERQPVPDDVVIRTLPFMPPTVRWELRVLLHKEYISKGITGDAENADYFLRPAGIRVAEELFDRMKTLASANAESTSKDANRKRTSKATAEASQKSIERADVNINNPNDVCAPVVKAINQLPAKMSRVLTRFHTPLDNDDVQEDEMEMIDFNYQNGMKWKDNVMAVFPNTLKDELDTKVDSIRKQHRKEFPYSYES